MKSNLKRHPRGKPRHVKTKLPNLFPGRRPELDPVLPSDDQLLPGRKHDRPFGQGLLGQVYILRGRGPGRL